VTTTLYAMGGREFPLICTTDDGGPFDTSSLLAGCVIGQLAAQLAHARTAKRHVLTEFLVPGDLIAQVDLMAMAFGYTMRPETRSVQGVVLVRVDFVDDETKGEYRGGPW